MSMMSMVSMRPPMSKISHPALDVLNDHAVQDAPNVHVHDIHDVPDIEDVLDVRKWNS